MNNVLLLIELHFFFTFEIVIGYQGSNYYAIVLDTTANILH